MDDGRGEWKDKISSQFDRLVAFASTELDKRRRSTEGASPRAGETTASCNTSPDSGIGHGEPLPPALSKMPRLFKTPPAKASPERDSPPVLEAPHTADRAGVARTPSPSSPVPNAPFSPAPLDGPYSPVNATLPGHGKDRQASSSATSVPLKYQRSESLSSQHFKKKFFQHRESWNPSSSASPSNNGHSSTHNSASNNSNAWHHKGKFRPKGKDWEWHGGSSNEEQSYRERDPRDQRDQRDQRPERERDHRDHRRDHRDHRSYHQSLPRYRSWDNYHENDNHPQGNF
ncbi:uncharacterized protein LOC127749431 [Frankliniella occidentalis]|nr:uncharacterized protein LOC127749431 [Frankliniella occidentalis]